MAYYDNNNEGSTTAAEIARKKLAGMNKPVVNENSVPLGININDTSRTTGSYPAPSQQITSQVTTAKPAFVTGDPLSDTTGPTNQRSISDIGNSIAGVARDSAIYARDSLRGMGGGGGEDPLNPFPSPWVSNEISREKQRMIQKTPQSIIPSGIYPVPVQDTKPIVQQQKTETPSQQRWKEFLPVQGAYTDAQGNTNSINTTARGALNNMSGSIGRQNAIPESAPLYTKKSDGSFRTNTGLDVKFDGSVPADRQEAFLRGPVESGYSRNPLSGQQQQQAPVQTTRTVEAPTMDAVEEPRFMTKEEAKAQGIGWKSRNAHNKMLADNYQAQLASATQRNTAGIGAASAQNVAGTNANAHLEAQKMHGKSAQEIARMNLTSPVNTAQAGNLNAQTTLHQQQAEQVKTMNDLNKEYNNEKTTPARRQQILAMTGKNEERRPQIVEYPGGPPDVTGVPTKIPSVLNPDGRTVTPLTPSGQGAQQYPPFPKNKKDAVKGKMYPTAFGPATWDGDSFVY